MDITVEAIVLLIVALAVIILLAVNIRIVPQASEFVIERLGKYKHTWGEFTLKSRFSTESQNV